ncbi:ABC transporter substrate-binding protein [Paraburkholderia pallida]|uniref:ABC transporter substrate-binding protein n=1 Tax=Paraburkholderia pallida TaxID=2547399 RepID=UPI0018D88882|nr:ABC transporter substrate-binding protein [Paraburkholderia pallida]
MKRTSRRTAQFVRGAVTAALVLAGACLTTQAAAQQAPLKDVTFLLAAPPGELAFAPFMLAQSKGYYTKAGLRVRWVAVHGGVDAGKQLAAGNGDLGDALGDTAIILRANGVNVKGVALLGGHPLHQLMTRVDRKVDSPADLKGKTLSVMSYEDTSYFAALGILGSANLTKADVDIQAGGPGVWKEVAAGKSDGIVGTPEWGADIEAAGVKVSYRPTDQFTPGMGQAIIASDKMIASDPATVRKFVQATLHAMNDIQADPDQASKDYVAAVPSYQGKLPFVTNVLTYYAKNVFPSRLRPGEFDPAIVAKVQDVYVDQKIVRVKQPVGSLYTNAFIQ